jgi:hypothetical protein
LPSASIVWSIGSDKLISSSWKHLEKRFSAVRGPPWSTLLLFQTELVESPPRPSKWGRRKWSAWGRGPRSAQCTCHE